MATVPIATGSLAYGGFSYTGETQTTGKPSPAR